MLSQRGNGRKLEAIPCQRSAESHLDGLPKKSVYS